MRGKEKEMNDGYDDENGNGRGRTDNEKYDRPRKEGFVEGMCLFSGCFFGFFFFG